MAAAGGAAAAAAVAAALVAAAVAEDIAINAILEYCGFDTLTNRTAIQDDGLGLYKDMLQLTEKDMAAVHKVCRTTMDTSIKAAMNQRRRSGCGLRVKVVQFAGRESSKVASRAGNQNSISGKTVAPETKSKAFTQLIN